MDSDKIWMLVMILIVAGLASVGVVNVYTGLDTVYKYMGVDYGGELVILGFSQSVKGLASLLLAVIILAIPSAVAALSKNTEKED